MMRKLLYVFLPVALFIMSGCNPFGESVLNPAHQPGYNEPSEIVELQGPHYAKLNSIGCNDPKDMEKVKLADFETTDNLIRGKRCFVIPTDTDIFVKDRATADIVSAHLKGSTQLFYTVRSNLIAK